MTTLTTEHRSLSSDAVELLQAEIISVCMEHWRSFKASNRNKRVIIDAGVRIYDMLIKFRSSQKTKLHVTQEPVSDMNIIAAFVDTLPLKLRDQVVAYVRKQD